MWVGNDVFINCSLINIYKRSVLGQVLPSRVPALETAVDL